MSTLRHWGSRTGAAASPALCGPNQNLDLVGRVGRRSGFGNNLLVGVKGVEDALKRSGVPFDRLHDAACGKHGESLRLLQPLENFVWEAGQPKIKAEGRR